MGICLGEKCNETWIIMKLSQLNIPDHVGRINAINNGQWLRGQQ